MKKSGILHIELSRIVAGMGHNDVLVVCDAGMPIPHNTPTADLALTLNIPRFIDTVRVVLGELKVERAVIASELEHVSRPMYDELMKTLGGIPVSKVSHDELKHLTRTTPNVSFVRTGEATPYANVMLISGVVF